MTFNKQKNQRTGKFSPKRFEVVKKVGGFKFAQKGIIICSNCKSVYSDKSWHHDLSEVKHLEKFEENDKKIVFKICPSCKLMKDNKFRGQIIIKNLPKESEEELRNLVRNFSQISSDFDPLDKVIEMNRSGQDFEILTTENQSAAKLAKKIKSSFSHFKPKLDIGYSHGEDFARVIINFKKD